MVDVELVFAALFVKQACQAVLAINVLATPFYKRKIVRHLHEDGPGGAAEEDVVFVCQAPSQPRGQFIDGDFNTAKAREGVPVGVIIPLTKHKVALDYVDGASGVAEAAADTPMNVA